MRVVCAVVFEEDRVLVCRRPIEKHEGGKWEFPGGKVEMGEGDEVALEREMMEELGVRVRVWKLLGESARGKITLVAYRCERMSGEWELREHLEACWITRDEGDELDWAALDIPLWQSVRARV